MLCLPTTWLLEHHAYWHLPPPAHSLPISICWVHTSWRAGASHTVIYLVVMMSLFLGQKRDGSMEEQAQDSLGLDVYRRLGEARRLVLEDPGARVQPTCFLTPVLLPVNPAALQPE